MKENMTSEWLEKIHAYNCKLMQGKIITKLTLKR